MDGSKFLRGYGILMVLFGVGTVIWDGIAMAETGMLTAMGASLTALWICRILTLLQSIVQIAAGILGIRYWNQPAKVGRCQILGGCMMVLCAGSAVAALIGYTAAFSLLSLLMGLILAGIYWVACRQCNKLAA